MSHPDPQHDPENVRIEDDPGAPRHKISRAQKLTRAQRNALLRIYRRDSTPRQSYLSFRRTAQVDHLLGCVMLPWCGMWLGIEPDGHTHS